MWIQTLKVLQRIDVGTMHRGIFTAKQHNQHCQLNTYNVNKFGIRIQIQVLLQGTTKHFRL